MSSRTTEASKGLVYLGLIAALTASTGIVAKEAKHVTEPEVRYEWFSPSRSAFTIPILHHLDVVIFQPALVIQL